MKLEKDVEKRLIEWVKNKHNGGYYSVSEIRQFLAQEIQTAVQKERKRILKEFVLAECEIPGEGKYGRAEFYHLSKTKYNELKDES